MSSQGQFNVNRGAVFAGLGQTRVDAGIIVINGTNAIQTGRTVEQAAGVWYGNNIFSGPGTFVWSGGTIAAAISLQTNIAFNITGAAQKLLDISGAPGVIRSPGPGMWTGAGTVYCDAASVFENDGTFTVQNDSSFAGYTGGSPFPVFINNGTFRKNTTTGTTIFHSDNGGVAFNNNGTVDLQTGSVAINGGYTLSGSPQLKLVLGGLNPGNQFSQETFAGSATLGGLLSVTLTSGFSPTNGQSFAIVTYGSESGQIGRAHV